MTVPMSPHAMAASPSVAASPTSLSTTSNNHDEEEEEAYVSSYYYCRVYFENENAGSKDLRVIFVMAEGHDGLNSLD